MVPVIRTHLFSDLALNSGILKHLLPNQDAAVHAKNKNTGNKMIIEMIRTAIIGT